DVGPAVEVAISTPVAGFEFRWRHLRRAENGMSSVVQIPISMEDATCGLYALVQRGAGIRRQDVEGSGLDSLLNGPLDGAREHVGRIFVHAEDEAAIDHHAVVVQAADSRAIVAVEVL